MVRNVGIRLFAEKNLKISNLKTTILKIFIEICNLFHFYDFQVINEKIKSKK